MGKVDGKHGNHSSVSSSSLMTVLISTIAPGMRHNFALVIFEVEKVNGFHLTFLPEETSLQMWVKRKSVWEFCLFLWLFQLFILGGEKQSQNGFRGPPDSLQDEPDFRLHGSSDFYEPGCETKVTL